MHEENSPLRSVPPQAIRFNRVIVIHLTNRSIHGVVTGVCFLGLLFARGCEFSLTDAVRC